jgi:hypothetical protein
MFKNTLTIMIAGMLMQLFCVQPASALSRAEKQAQRIEKLKAGILKLGLGTDARVAITLRDHAKLAGFVTEANEESFIVTDPKTRATTTVAYADVTQVKGNNLGTGAKIAIGIGIGVGVTLLVLFLYINAVD